MDSGQRGQVPEVRSIPRRGRTLRAMLHAGNSTGVPERRRILLHEKDTPWKSNSVWQNIEYPWLTRNLAVKRIWRVDPRPPEVKGIKPEEACDHDKKELLWERGKDTALKPDFDCPVK